MSHPAILIEREGQETICWREQHTSGYPAGGRCGAGDIATRSFDYRVEPESVKNPIREDGTRALSAYFSKSITFRQKSSPVRTHSLPWYGGAWFDGPTTSQMDAWRAMFRFGGANAFNMLHNPSRVWIEQRARTAFLNKLADRSGKDEWELGVVAGEFRETAGMAVDLADGLIHSVQTIARGVKKSPKLVADTLRIYGEQGRKAALKNLGGQETIGILDTIVESWLVKQFGLDPLVNDLYTAQTQLQADLIDPVKGAETFTTIIRGGLEDTIKWREYVSGNCWGGFGYVYLTETVKYNFSAKYRIPVKATVSQKLGLYNPALLAAQLTRFSWMVDYVTDLSSWLRSLMAGQDCKFLEGTMSMLCKTLGDRGELEARYGYAVDVDPYKSGFLLVSHWFERTLLPPVGVMPAFLPGVKNQLNATKVANSIAALTTLVGARSRLPGPPVIKY